MSVRTEREQYNGRKMIQDFREYCKKKGINLNEDNLKSWDEKHNGRRIQKSFGTPREIYDKGLRILYRKWLDHYTMLSIRLKGERKSISVAGIKSDGKGGRRFLADMDRAGLAYNRKKTTMELQNATIRLKLYGMSPKEIHRIVDEALQSAEEENLSASAA